MSVVDSVRAVAPRQAAGRLGGGVAGVLALFVAARLLGLLAVCLADGGPGAALRLLCGRWDSLWYERIVRHGYAFTLHPPDGRTLSSLAFFPLYPGLEKAVAAGTGLSVPHAGLAVAWLSALAAAWGVHRVGALLGGPRLATCLVLLWAAWPVAVVQSMAYTESTFTALAAWALYALLRERWLTAGLLTALAGLTRPSAGALVVAVWLAVALTARRAGAPGRRPLAAALLAPAGLAGYVAWVGARTGSPLGYLHVQAGWGNGFDGGWSFARFVGGRLAHHPAAGLGLCAAVGVAAWALVRLLRGGWPAPLLGYAATLAVLTFGAAGYFCSKPRLLMPAFPLLLPLAARLSRARPAARNAALAAAVLGSAAYGAVLLGGSGPP